MATNTQTSVDDSIQLLRHLSRTLSTEGGDIIPFSDELELLQNVYFNELEIVKEESPVVLKFRVTPSTGDEKEKQFVYVEVLVSVDTKYPACKPDIAINQSRGVSDAHLQSVVDGVHHLALDHIGSPMIFDLIEYIRDCLTDNNRPCGKCALCQYEFQEDDQFLRTECYHYFHPPCFADYVHLYCSNNKGSTKQSKQVVCPVCRVTVSGQCIDNAQVTSPSSHTDDTIFIPDPSLLLWQREMAVLYHKQVARGGIIDSKETPVDWEWVSTKSGGRENKETEEIEGNKDTENGEDKKEGDKINDHEHHRPRPSNSYNRPRPNYKPRPPNSSNRPRSSNYRHQNDKRMYERRKWQGGGHDQRERVRDQGERGCDQERWHDQEERQYDQGERQYDQERGCDQGQRWHDQGERSHDQERWCDQGERRYDQGERRHDQGERRRDQERGRDRGERWRDQGERGRRQRNKPHTSDHKVRSDSNRTRHCEVEKQHQNHEVTPIAILQRTEPARDTSATKDKPSSEDKFSSKDTTIPKGEIEPKSAKTVVTQSSSPRGERRKNIVVPPPPGIPRQHRHTNPCQQQGNQ